MVRPILHDLVNRCIDEDIMKPQAVYGWFRCKPDGDRLLIDVPDGDPVSLAFPRQRLAAGQTGEPHAIPDFFHPDGDVVGLMAVTVGQRVSDIARQWFEADDYRNYLYLHGLSVELAEALAEFVHRQMRSELGIAGDDSRELSDLFKGEVPWHPVGLWLPGVPADGRPAPPAALAGRRSHRHRHGRRRAAASRAEHGRPGLPPPQSPVLPGLSAVLRDSAQGPCSGTVLRDRAQGLSHSDAMTGSWSAQPTTGRRASVMASSSLA